MIKTFSLTLAFYCMQAHQKITMSNGEMYRRKHGMSEMSMLLCHTRAYLTIAKISLFKSFKCILRQLYQSIFFIRRGVSAIMRY